LSKSNKRKSSDQQKQQQHDQHQLALQLAHARAASDPSTSAPHFVMEDPDRYRVVYDTITPGPSGGRGTLPVHYPDGSAPLFDPPCGGSFFGECMGGWVCSRWWSVVVVVVVVVVVGSSR